MTSFLEWKWYEKKEKGKQTYIEILCEAGFPLGCFRGAATYFLVDLKMEDFIWFAERNFSVADSAETQ